MRLKAKFDLDPAVTLLRKWIAAFSIPAHVAAVVEPQPDSFLFEVTVTHRDYWKAMIVPLTPNGPTIAGALGTLFRAIGATNNVSIQVMVRRL